MVARSVIFCFFTLFFAAQNTFLKALCTSSADSKQTKQTYKWKSTTLSLHAFPANADKIQVFRNQPSLNRSAIYVLPLVTEFNLHSNVSLVSWIKMYLHENRLILFHFLFYVKHPFSTDTKKQPSAVTEQLWYKQQRNGLGRVCFGQYVWLGHAFPLSWNVPQTSSSCLSKKKRRSPLKEEVAKSRELHSCVILGCREQVTLYL